MNNQGVDRRLRSYFQERAAEPVPIGMEQRILCRALDGSGPAPRHAWFWQAAGALAVTALALGIGLAILYARSQASPASRSPIATPGPRPSAPQGGVAPAELQGQWIDTSDLSGDNRLVIRAANLVWGGARVELVVQGNEIDFYNGNACGIRLPGGVGRYQWSINGGLLRFEPLAPDPCTDRPKEFAGPFRKVADSG